MSKTHPSTHKEILIPHARFWEIAIPMTITVALLFLWTDFTRMAERVKKTMREKKIDKVNM